MTVFTRTWNAAYEAQPAGGDDISDGDDQIRNLKSDIQERTEVDHSWAGDADDGEHVKVTLAAPIADPSNVANKGFLYLKDVSAVVELFWEDESGNVIQMTSGGKLLIANTEVDTTGIVDDAVTLAKIAAATQGDVLYYGASGAPAVLSAGTSGQALVTGGAGANPAWAGVGGRVLIETQEISGSATVDFTTGIDSTYEKYEIEWAAGHVATDSVGLLFRVAIAGPTWGSADYKYSGFRSSLDGASGVVAEAGSSSSGILLVDGSSAADLGNAADESFSGRITISKPSETAFHKIINYEMTWLDPNGLTSTVRGGGCWVGGTGAIIGGRFLASSGNIDGGRWSLYGIRHA